MPQTKKGLAFRPQLESFERRDVPTIGLIAHAAVVAVPAPHATHVVALAIPRTVGDPFATLATIGRQDLRPGDILVSTEAGGISQTIRKATLSAYSHASLYIGDGKIIDATKPGVRERNLAALTQPALRVGVIRVGSLTAAQTNQVLSTTKSLVGKPYNTTGLAVGLATELNLIYRTYRLVTGNALKVSGSTLGRGYFCSELVIKAYKSAGLTVAPEAGDTPGGIIDYAMSNPAQFQLAGRLAVGKA